MPDRPGPAALQPRRPARQGGRREPRASPCRACRDGPGAAAQANHHQPFARRPAEGRQPLRPADCAGVARGDGGDRRRAVAGLDRGRRAGARRAHRAIAGRAARRHPCERRGKGPDLSRRARRRGALGERHPGLRRARPGQPAQSPEGRADAARAAAGRGGRCGAGARPQDGQRPGNRQTRARDRRGRRAQPSDDRPGGPTAIRTILPRSPRSPAAACASSRARSAWRTSACCSSTSCPSSSARCSIRCASRSRRARSAWRAPTPT